MYAIYYLVKPAGFFYDGLLILKAGYSYFLLDRSIKNSPQQTS